MSTANLVQLHAKPSAITGVVQLLALAAGEALPEHGADRAFGDETRGVLQSLGVFTQDNGSFVDIDALMQKAITNATTPEQKNHLLEAVSLAMNTGASILPDATKDQMYAFLESEGLYPVTNGNSLEQAQHYALALGQELPSGPDGVMGGQTRGALNNLGALVTVNGVEFINTAVLAEKVDEIADNPDVQRHLEQAVVASNALGYSIIPDTTRDNVATAVNEVSVAQVAKGTGIDIAGIGENFPYLKLSGRLSDKQTVQLYLEGFGLSTGQRVVGELDGSWGGSTHQAIQVANEAITGRSFTFREGFDQSTSLTRTFGQFVDAAVGRLRGSDEGRALFVALELDPDVVLSAPEQLAVLRAYAQQQDMPVLDAAVALVNGGNAQTRTADAAAALTNAGVVASDDAAPAAPTAVMADAREAAAAASRQA